MERTGNLIEGFLWIAIGVCFLLSLIRSGGRGVKTLASLTFVAFGLTDFVEMQTGAWWRPWWLLVWKGACIAVMGGCWSATFARPGPPRPNLNRLW